MCGDFDNNEQVDDEMFERFIGLIGQFGVTPGAATNGARQSWRRNRYEPPICGTCLKRG